MALETWLVKVKTAVSSGLDAVKSSPALHHKSAKRQKMGVLVFEVANLMSRLLQLWRSLSDSNVVRLRNEIISLEGVRKIVSNDEAFLLGLACAEMVENVRSAVDLVRRLGERCEDSSLLCFGRIVEEFVDMGRDLHRWVQNGKDVEVFVKRMDRFVASTMNLLLEMDELAVLENSLRKAVSTKLDERNDSSRPISSLMTTKSINSLLTDREQRISDLQQRIVWHKQEIKRLKERSLWNRSFDSVTLLLARSIFTTLDRIKLVFVLGRHYSSPSLLPCSPSSSAAIHPTESHETLISAAKTECLESKGFFESNSRLLEPPATTLGANGLSLHYANLIIVMEKMIKLPQLVGPDAREDLYAMLPSSIRSCLRERLKGVVFSASDEALARKWREALGRILGWLCPLAHNMIKWQSERSFEQNANRHNGGETSEKAKDVFLLQTVFFANKEKTEAAITELLVGLNYIWRFEREKTIKALFECNSVGNLLNFEWCGGISSHVVLGTDAVSPKKTASKTEESLLLHHNGQPRCSSTFLFLTFLSLQIILFLSSRSLPSSIPSHSVHRPFQSSDQCSSGRIYVYELPSFFNSEILDKCDNFNPWSLSCKSLANKGFGPPAAYGAGIMPEGLVPAWFSTDQFVSEVIFHNRIMKHKCRTTDPASAAAFYIPFYAGLAVGKYLWLNHSAEDRDRHCKMMLDWVKKQEYYRRSSGWNHFITMGRITWDFRRSKNEDWGSSCIHMGGMRNITRLLIEQNPWDYFDVGVPYPIGFHPRSDSDVAAWQDFVRTRQRDTLFCFAGGTRREIKNDFRGLLLNQCRNASGSCQAVNCAAGLCSNDTSAILRTFLGSKFCLQPRGDSFTRRSIFDCMVAGSIPVLFWRRSAYFQYEWFIPSEPESYSVFIDRNEVKSGRKSIREVLEAYSAEDVRRMREKVIESIPRLVYSLPEEGLESLKDAFDVSIEGVLRRFKEQEHYV